MEAQITLRINVASTQKLTATRDKLAAEIEADEDLELIAKNSAEDEPE